jgi:ATP-binding cassette subfamily D (ALD) protein 3
MKIAIPSVFSKEMVEIIVLALFFVCRTVLSIYIAAVNGQIVKSIVNVDVMNFAKSIGNLALIALPASFINSYLEFLQKKFALNIKRNLTNYFHSIYLKDKVFYQLTGIEKSLGNPD